MKAYCDQFFSYLLTEKRVSLNTFNAYKTDILQLLHFLEKKEITSQQLSLKDLKFFLQELKNSCSATSMARKISSNVDLNENDFVQVELLKIKFEEEDNNKVDIIYSGIFKILL